MNIMDKDTHFPSIHQVKRIMALTFVAHVLWYQALYCQENNGRGTKGIGMANTLVSVADDPWAAEYNSAGLAWQKIYKLAAFAIPAQFELPELRTVAISMVIPFSLVTSSITIERFGFDLYSEIGVSIASGWQLNDHIAVGAVIDLHHSAIQQYESEDILNADIGVLMKISEKVTLGTNIQNILQISTRKCEDPIPQVFQCGLAYQAIPEILFAVSIEKDIRFNESYAAGVEYNVYNMFWVRGGLATNPNKLSCGFAIKSHSLELSYAGYVHPVLGWSHQIEIQFEIL